MKVKELAEWLTNFHDQEAEVLVVEYFETYSKKDLEIKCSGNSQYFSKNSHVEYKDNGNRDYFLECHNGPSRTILLGMIKKS